MSVEIEGDLTELNSILDSIKSKLAWEQLALAEQRPGGPPSFQLQTSTREIMRREMPVLSSRFLSLALDIHEALDHLKRGLRKEVEDWRERLQQLEREFRELRIHERFVTL